MRARGCKIACLTPRSHQVNVLTATLFFVAVQNGTDWHEADIGDVCSRDAIEW
jgi:hypothetical protein